MQDEYWAQHLDDLQTEYYRMVEALRKDGQLRVTNAWDRDNLPKGVKYDDVDSQSTDSPSAPGSLPYS